jgi:anti-sigma B factor antagonist
MPITVTVLENGIGVIAPEGKLVSGDETDALREATNSLSMRDCSKVILDLSAVTFLDSTAIGILVSTHTHYQRREWRAVLCGINDRLLGIFTITNLVQVFETYDNRENALRNLSAIDG